MQLLFRALALQVHVAKDNSIVGDVLSLGSQLPAFPKIHMCRPKLCAAINWSARGSVFCTEKTRAFLRTLL